MKHLMPWLLATSLTNPLFGDTQGVVNTKSFAAYADWTFDLTDKHKLDVGARYTDEAQGALVQTNGTLDLAIEGDSRIVLGVHYPLDIIGSRAFSAYNLAQAFTNPAYIDNAATTGTAINLTSLFTQAQGELQSYL